MTVSEPGFKALHPLSVAVNLIPRLWRVLRGLWPLLLALWFGRGPSGMVLDLGFIALPFGLAALSALVHWLTLRYRVADGRLEIRTGILNRQVRVIAPDRIQNTERTQNVFQKMAGLVEVRIETASGSEVEGMLSALSVEDADALIGALEAARSIRREETSEEARLVTEASLTDLLWYGATAWRIGLIAVVLGVGFELITWQDPDALLRTQDSLGAAGGALLVTAVITGTWLFGLGASVLRHWRFELRHTGTSLVASDGLLTRRSVELPLRKVQLVTLAEPLLRRLAGFGTVHIETAAVREDGNGTQRAEAVAPVVDSEELLGMAAMALQQKSLDNLVLRPPANKALIRSGIVAINQGVILAGGLTLAFGWWGALAWLTLPLLLAEAWLDHRYQGWIVTDSVMVARSGYINRKTRVLARAKLQSTEVLQGPILRRWNLAVLVVRVAGASMSLPVMEAEEARRLQADLRTRPAGPVPPHADDALLPDSDAAIGEEE